jgi:hypothetical protein
MQGLSYHLRREGLEMRSRFGLRAILIHLLVIAVFGVALPWMRGIEFLDPVMTAAYACLGLLFAAPAVAQGFALTPPTSIIEALARIALAVAYGQLMAGAILLLGFVTVYTTNRFAPPPDVLTLAEACTLGIAASVALSSISAWIALQFSAGVARNAMRVMFLLLLYLFFLKARWLPDIAIQASIISVGVAILAIFAIRRQLNPR